MIQGDRPFSLFGGVNMRINVHAGHNPDGMIACGAIGLIKESTEARAVKDSVVAQLTSMGHTVRDCTCNNGISQNDILQKIVAACNAQEADLDISIHFSADRSRRTYHRDGSVCIQYIFRIRSICAAGS